MGLGEDINKEFNKLGITEENINEYDVEINYIQKEDYVICRYNISKNNEFIGNIDIKLIGTIKVI